MGDHEARVPPGRFTKMTLELAHGVPDLTLHAGADADALVAVRFDGGRPLISVDGDVVRINRGRHASALTLLADLVVHGVSGPTCVALGAGASWHVLLRAGASQVRADLTHVHLDALEISGGANHVVLTLPRPRGVVPVRIRGGASSVRIARPTGTAMRVAVAGGACDLTFDGAYIDAVGNRRELVSRGYYDDDAGDRYEVEMTGGASELCVVERDDDEEAAR